MDMYLLDRITITGIIF